METSEGTRNHPLVIGSRGSELALWQARHVSGFVKGPSEIRIITTSGDRFLTVIPTGQIEKGFFTKEIEEELLAGRVDIAVHSLKDLPTQLGAGLELGAVSQRETIVDLLLVNPGWLDDRKLVPVRAGGRVGATSLRRQSMVRRFGDGLDAAVLRGNVPTRVRKCRDGEYAAVIIAGAGVARLGLDLSGLAVFDMNPQIWLPAPGQAALGIEIRAGDEQSRQAVSAIDDPVARRCTGIERALLHRFEGGCHEPFGAWARLEGDQLVVKLGHEDARGRWRSVQLQGDGEDDAQVVARAFAVLRGVLEAEEDTSVVEEGELCRRRSS